MSAPAIAVHDLHKRLGHRWALRGVTLAIERQQIVALLGPNGAGKTTLLRCICGRLRPDRGRVTLHGRDPSRRAARQRLGLVPQDLALFPRLTVQENLEIFGRLLQVPRGRLAQRVQAGLEQAGLTERAGHVVTTLSGGMRRRLNLAASLIHEPEVLLLDEPTVGVDARAVEEIQSMLSAQSARGTAVLLITHDLELAERLAHHVVLLNAGSVQAQGAPGALVREAFGEQLDVSLSLPHEPDAALRALLTDWHFASRGSRTYARRCTGAQADALLHELNERGIRPRELRVRDPGLVDVYEAALRGEVAG